MYIYVVIETGYPLLRTQKLLKPSISVFIYVPKIYGKFRLIISSSIKLLFLITGSSHENVKMYTQFGVLVPYNTFLIIKFLFWS